MTKKTILLIADDAKVSTTVQEIVGREYLIENVVDGDSASAFLAKHTPDLMLIDFDLKGKDGLQIFRELKTTARAVMFSTSGNIPLAVSATKLGVVEFLRKPLNAEELTAAIHRSLPTTLNLINWPHNSTWFQGESPKLIKLLAELKLVLNNTKDLILMSEIGIEKQAVAQLLHLNGGLMSRKLAVVDLAQFRRENQESHFWMILQELMTVPASSSLAAEAELCGTILLNNVDSLEENFQNAIYKFIKERSGRIDKNIRVVIGLAAKAKPQPGFVVIKIPPLRERKEDLALLLQLYLEKISRELGLELKYLSPKILKHLLAYDYPGNYLELESLCREALLVGQTEKLDLTAWPLSWQQLKVSSLKTQLRTNSSLNQAKKYLERELYNVLLNKADNNAANLGLFLDLPKSSLTDRLEDLVH